jgi:hypothetical protein
MGEFQELEFILEIGWVKLTAMIALQEETRTKGDILGTGFIVAVNLYSSLGIKSFCARASVLNQSKSTYPPVSIVA